MYCTATNIRVSIRADHGSIEWILDLSDSSGRLDRWRIRLFKLDVDVVYQARENHKEKLALF